MLERLRDRAKIAFAQFQGGLGSQPTVDETEFPDDVAIISGRASVINRSGSSQSPNSTSRLSESPQSMPMGISGAMGTSASANTSPVVSDARAHNIHGNVNMTMGDDAMQDMGLEYYNPNHTQIQSHQHSQYVNGTNGVNGVGGANGAGSMNGLGMSGMVGMNGMNGSMNHGNGGTLPPPPPHLGMDQYRDPHSQQYIMVRILHIATASHPDVNGWLAIGSTSRIPPPTTGLWTPSSSRLADAWARGSRRDLDELHAPVDDPRRAASTSWVHTSDVTLRLIDVTQVLSSFALGPSLQLSVALSLGLLIFATVIELSAFLPM